MGIRWYAERLVYVQNGVLKPGLVHGVREDTWTFLFIPRTEEYSMSPDRVLGYVVDFMVVWHVHGRGMLICSTELDFAICLGSDA